MKKYLVTGSSGFIGYHLCKRLLDEGKFVVGIDNQNDYYDVDLKIDRNEQLQKYNNFSCYYNDISDKKHVDNIFNIERPDIVCNLAAYAGIPYSMENPYIFEHVNCEGFLNIIEASKKYEVSNFIYASSSSIYGKSKSPTKEEDDTEHPLNIYAASKKYNEVLAYSYSESFGMNCTGLRFFTCYGPWGRPDMSIYIWTKAIFEDKELIINNNGEMFRDYTYVGDIVDGIIRVMDKPQKYAIYNLGRGETVKILDVIEIIEDITNLQAKKKMVSLPKGELLTSLATIDKASKEIGYNPKISISEGVQNFIEWYVNYFKEKQYVKIRRCPNRD